MSRFNDPYRVLLKVYSGGAHLKLALADRSLDEAGKRDTVKTAYGVLENDGYLSLCIATFAPKQPKLPVRIVLKIALYRILFLGQKRELVANAAVEFIKELGKSGAAGFLNAFLRKFDERRVVLPEGDEGLCVKYNFPLFAVRRIKRQYGDRAEQILAAKSHGVCVRFMRGEERYLSLPHERTPFPHLFLFPNFTRDEGFFKGDYTFQSIGSVAICSVVEPSETLLDACAAPGGKSVLLSETCQKITACELHPHRVELIKSYCARMGVENVTPVEGDSTEFRPEWEGAFHAVLCDVPCSGLGTVAENPDLPLNKREEDLKGLNRTQLAILETCARYVREGGALYYSTCSLLEEENDGVLSAFLSHAKEFVSEPVDCPLPHEKTAFGLQFLPDRAFGAGFYVSKLRRKA